MVICTCLGTKPGEKSRRVEIRKSTGDKWFVVVLLAAALAAAYAWTLATFRGETGAATVGFGEAGPAGSGRIELSVSVLEVDPLMREISIRIIPRPVGAFLAKDGSSLNRDIVLGIRNARASFGSTLAEGQSEIVFRAGEAMAPLDVTLMLEGGPVDNYPFDKYTSALQVNASQRDPAAPSGYAAAPVNMLAALGIAGYSITAKEVSAEEGSIGRDENPETAADTVSLALDISRSSTSFWFAVFLMGVVAMISLACAAVAACVSVLGRKVEPQFFTWMAGTLFAIVGLRNVLPGNPPLGALPDFLAFLWAELITAAALLCIVGVYLRRGPPAKAEAADLSGKS